MRPKQQHSQTNIALKGLKDQSSISNELVVGKVLIYNKYPSNAVLYQRIKTEISKNGNAYKVATAAAAADTNLHAAVNSQTIRVVKLEYKESGIVMLV